MSFIGKYFKTTALLLTIALFFSGCSSDENFSENLPEKDKFMKLVLNIHPLATRSVTDASVSEMIQSLRIIIIDTDNNEIEENKLVTLDGSEVKPVLNFQYFYTWDTTAGNKRLILLANEEYVTDVNYNPAAGVSLPDDLPSSLSDVLNSYLPGNEADAETFYNIISSVYFQPAYEINDNSQIFLPYVAIYEEEITPPTPNPSTDTDIQTPLEWTTYLVPVATKFTFIFNNYRENAVNVNQISMKNSNLDNYLIAHVGSTDLNKSFDGEEYYWIDWLAKVAMASTSNTGSSQNNAFNTQYGWISNYEIPTAASQESIFMIAGPGEEYGFSVPGAQLINVDEGLITPSTVTAGPFYVPESKNFLNVATGLMSDTQIYFLTIALADTNPDAVAPSFENVGIPNLQALFRDTSVLITLNFKSGDVEVYAEVNDWNKQAANGWLEKGDTPDFLTD